jgi:single-stranded DNA-binding protein
MIQGLIAGTLLAKPEVREGKNGSAFTLAKVRAVSGDGESLILNAIAFSPQASAALLALEDGDAVAVSGALTPKVWLDKQGNARPALDMIVNRVLAADLFEALQSTQG